MLHSSLWSSYGAFIFCGDGSVAVALAAQNILKDLLSSLSIILDKPFVVGDFIVIGNEMGTVEEIGTRSTKIRSLTGEQIIMTNRDLLDGRIRNFKRMHERRVVQTFSILSWASIEKIKRIPQWVKEFIEKEPKLRFDRCHLAQITDNSLKYEFVFWVKSADYNLFMDLQEKVLVQILDKLESENIALTPRQILTPVVSPNIPNPELHS